MSENQPQIPIEEPCNWTATDFSLVPKPQYLLESAMINEIETAARTALAEGRPHYEWRKTDFNLLKANFNQEFKHLQFFVHRHRRRERLVAVA